MSRPTSKELERSLEDLVRNWERFARNLPKIKQSHIDKIKYNKKDDIDSQKVALYDKWLEVYPNASWDDVINALREADENTLAQTIENKLSSADRNMSLSPKQPIENETVCNPVSSNPIQQAEVYDVPESVVDELKELHDTFVPLAMDVKNEIESQVDKGKVTVKSLLGYTEEQRAFPIENHTTSINDSQTFLSAIKPHYNFLNPYLLVMLAIQFLSNSYIAQRAKDYHSKITAFNNSTSVRSLVDTLKHYRDHLRPTTSNKIITIRVNNCLNKDITIWVVQMLIQTLFPIVHPDEVPWYEVCQGSLVLSFIATDNMLLPFIVSCARKIEFMRLLGIVSVSIGNVYMVVNRNTEPFTLENSLIEATASGNVEAVKFLLEYFQVNPNVKCNDKHILCLEEEIYKIAILTPFENTFAELILDIKKEVEKHKMKGDSTNDSVSQVINSYFEKLHCQHNFLNTSLLSSQSSHLSKRLQQRIKQYCEGIEEIKREAKLCEFQLTHFVSDSQLKDRKFIPVSLTLCSDWAFCSMSNVEQLIKVIFPSVTLEHFNWCRISDDHFQEIFQIRFLVPKELKKTFMDDLMLKEEIARALGVFMIEIEDMLAFEGRYSMIHNFHFERSLQNIKHNCKNEQAIHLLEQIVQKPILTMSIISCDMNNNWHCIPDSDSTPLMIACCNGNEELVELLLKYNTDLNIRTTRNITALLYSSHNAKIFHMLLDHGADSSIIATSMKRTALRLACTCGNLKIVDTMIKRHPSFVNMADAMGRTPLWYASLQGCLPIVKRLLQENMVDSSFADIEEVTPLLIAIYFNHLPVVNALLEAKVNPNCCDKIMKSTPLLLAVSQKNLQLVEKLLKMNADPNVINSHGESPLWIASAMGNLELVEKLLHAKADLNLYNKNENKMLKPIYATTTPLYAASSEGHLDIVNRLLEAKADPNLRGSAGLTPLMGSAKIGSIKITERLLQARADPNIRNSVGETALGAACDQEYMPVIDLLLRAKADPNIRFINPLWMVCINGSLSVVERLLQEPNIDLDIPDEVNGNTPLLVAIANDNIEIVNRLLQAHADPSIQNNHGETPIQVAIHRGLWSVVDKLLECKVDLNMSSSKGNTPLLNAVSQGNTKLVKKLLKMNANPNVINIQGMSPIKIAIGMGNMELVEILLQAKADLNLYYTNNENKTLESYNTSTPLISASILGHLDIVSRLLEEKADPNLCDNDSLTPLMGAAIIGSVEITEKLLQARADLNIQRESDGETAMGLACNNGHVAVIDLLLRAKADPNIQNEFNLTPLWRACYRGNISIVKRLLQEPNVNPNTPDKIGNTPLMAATHNGHPETVELLLEAHVNPNIQNNRGETPLLVAVDNEEWLIVEQLLEYEADPNISSDLGKTPLLVAVEQLHPTSIIESLLQANADPTISTPDGTSPLWAAVMIGDIPLIMRLLQAL